MPIDLDGISGGATLLLAMGGHTSCSLSCQFVARRPVTNRAVGRCVRWKILSRRSASKTATALLLNSSSSNGPISLPPYVSRAALLGVRRRPAVGPAAARRVVRLRRWLAVGVIRTVL